MNLPSHIEAEPKRPGLTRLQCPRCLDSMGLHPPGMVRRKKRCKSCRDLWLITTELTGVKLSVTWELKSRSIPVSAEEQRYRQATGLPDIMGSSGTTPLSATESGVLETPDGTAND